MSRELEQEDGNDEPEGDDEPSLGSFDRMADQDKAWRQTSLWAFPAVDGEQDDADHEDGDPAEESDTGIADQDGLDEQVPLRDWQNVGMV